MEITSSTTGDEWEAACPRENCTYRIRRDTRTEVESEAADHEAAHERKDANERIRDAWEARARDIMTPHLGHAALLCGYYEREITDRSLQRHNITMAYAGYPVRCQTCDISLSEQWNN